MAQQAEMAKVISDRWAIALVPASITGSRLMINLNLKNRPLGKILHSTSGLYTRRVALLSALTC